MRHRLGTVLTAGALAAIPLSLAAPASADTPGCVSRAEFRAVTKGMNITRVHATFDTAGKQSFYFPAYPDLGIAAEQTRAYKTCGSQYGTVNIAYNRVSGSWKLKSKTAFWGF